MKTKPEKDRAVVEAIDDARDRWKANRADRVNPTRVFVGEYAYDLLHDIAEGHEVPAIRHPKFDDDRLEYQGMRVHCHRSAAIEFE